MCLDKNAGYGYIAEIETITETQDNIETERDQILTLIKNIGYEELSQERIERMFAHYNAHWQDYYGTENMFELE